MGEVYLAWHELMERWVAIKMLKQSFVEDHMSVKRFQQEAKAASRLKHPNVISLYEFGVTTTGQPYMVMDYLVGYDKAHPAMSLAQMIKEYGSEIPVEIAIIIVSQACAALEHAHRQGVIHRDVKPANIMIVPTEAEPYQVKVVDFGVAKLLPINQTGEQAQGLTQVGEVCGSPVYMSPEQCLGQALDARADIYSMGVVLYETLTGKLPLVGKNMVETMGKHMNEAPPPFKKVRSDLFIPDKVEQVCMRALAKEPHKRQQSMAELAQDLQFSIPRPGQTPNLKTHQLESLPDREENIPPWVVPVVVCLAVMVISFGVYMLLFNKSNPVPVAVPAVPASAVPGSAVPGSAGALTSVPATPQPKVSLPSSNVTTAPVSTSILSPTANEQKSGTASVTAPAVVLRKVPQSAALVKSSSAAKIPYKMQRATTRISESQRWDDLRSSKSRQD